MKTCIKCGETKGEELFSWKVLDKKRNGTCKDCHKQYRRAHYEANRQKYIDKARRWEAENGGKRNIRYRLAPDRYLELLGRFDGLCWLCQSKPGKVIDHDHSCCSSKDSTCGACVRGILCYTCNMALGMLGDTLESVKRALKYLEEISLTSIKVM